MVHQTITKKPQQSPLSTNSTIEQMQGVSAEIKLEKPALAEVDGDMLGRTRHILITVDKQSLTVRAPENDPAKADAPGAATAPAGIPAESAASDPARHQGQPAAQPQTSLSPAKATVSE